MSRKEFQIMFVGASSLPTKDKAFECIEAINPDSLQDAFEVADDWAEGVFNRLNK